MFVLLFKRIEENSVKKDHRDSFSYFYMPNIKIKEFNVLINGKGFFEMPVKIKKKSMRKLLTSVEIMTTQVEIYCILLILKKNYRLIAIDLSKQTKSKDPQQISFIGKLENQAHGGTIFFIIENSEESTFEFLQNSVNIL